MSTVDGQKEAFARSHSSPIGSSTALAANGENGAQMESMRPEPNEAVVVADTNRGSALAATASDAPPVELKLIRFHTPDALIHVPNPYSITTASNDINYNNSVAISIAADSDELPPLPPAGSSRSGRLMSHTISAAPVSGRQSWQTAPREILILVAQNLDGVSLARFCGVDNLCNSIGHEKKLWSVLITKAWNFRVEHQNPLFQSIMTRPPQRAKLMAAVSNAKIGSFQEKTNNPRTVYERNFKFALGYLAGLKREFLKKKATSKQKNRAYCFHVFFDVMEAVVIMGLFAAFVGLLVYELKTRNQDLIEIPITNLDGSISFETVNMSPESPLSLLPFIPLFVMEGYALVSAIFHAIVSQMTNPYANDSSRLLPNDYLDDSESIIGLLIKGSIKTIRDTSDDRGFEYVESQRRCVSKFFQALGAVSLIAFLGSFALFTVFLALKCAGYIDSWSWFSVFAPFYCFCGLLLLGHSKMLGFIKTEESWFWGLIWIVSGAPLLVFTCLLASKLEGNNIPLLQVFIPFWILDGMLLLSCCYLTPLVFMSWDEDDEDSWDWGRCLIPLGYLAFVAAFILWKTFLVLLVDYHHMKYSVELACIPFFVLVGVAFIVACAWALVMFLDNKSTWRGDYVRDEWLGDDSVNILL